MEEYFLTWTGTLKTVKWLAVSQKLKVYLLVKEKKYSERGGGIPNGYYSPLKTRRRRGPRILCPLWAAPARGLAQGPRAGAGRPGEQARQPAALNLNFHLQSGNGKGRPDWRFTALSPSRYLQRTFSLWKKQNKTPAPLAFNGSSQTYARDWELQVYFKGRMALKKKNVSRSSGLGRC